MLPIIAREYILAALDNTPGTLSYLLPDKPSDGVVWDVQPYPDLFTLREIVAHLSDWDAIFQERFERTLREHHPILSRPDLDRRALEKGYTDADPLERLARFRGSRSTMTAWLRALPAESWGRTAHLERVGDMSLDGLSALMLGHDAYHIRQLAEWLNPDAT